MIQVDPPIYSPKVLRNILLLCFIINVRADNILAQTQKTSDQDQVEAVIGDLYDQVTFPPGEEPDWDHVRTMFIKDATITMRTGPNTTNTLDLNGWILDFVNFIYRQNIRESGFEEKIIKMETMVFGDIAHVMVLYTAYISGVSKEPKEGVDSFHCIKVNGTWKIVSILNEIPGPNRPKPTVLK